LPPENLPSGLHVAIIGGGFTGTSAFYQLVRDYPVTKITMYEASGEFGPGYAYREDECPEYFMNNTADTLSLAPDEPMAFHAWLQTRPEYRGCEPSAHLPRRIFGTFLKSMFAQTLARAAARGIDVQLIRAEATDMYEAGGGVRIVSAQGESSADIAIMTTGRCPDRNIFPTPEVKNGARYYPTHIPGRVLDDVPNDAACHIIGTSLSAYDVVTRLFSEETGCRFERGPDGRLVFVPGSNRRSVVLCSRSGRLKKVQSRAAPAFSLCCFTPERLAAFARNGGASLRELADLVLEEAAAHSAELDLPLISEPYAGCPNRDAITQQAARILRADITAARQPPHPTANFLVDFFRLAFFTIWDSFTHGGMSDAAERSLRQNYETALRAYSAPLAAPVAEKLLALLEAGRVEILRGVQMVTLSDDQRHYLIHHSHGVAVANLVINATGLVERHVSAPTQPALIRSLWRRGLLKPHRRGAEDLPGADIEMDSFRARDAKNIYVVSMLLWGPGWFVSSTTTMSTVMQRMLRQIFKPPQAA